VVKSAIFYL